MPIFSTNLSVVLTVYMQTYAANRFNKQKGKVGKRDAFYHFLGSGPDRGQSPVEWGEIPSVCTSKHPYICMSVRCPTKGSEGHLMGSEALPERFEALPEGCEELP